MNKSRTEEYTDTSLNEEIIMNTLAILVILVLGAMLQSTLGWFSLLPYAAFLAIILIILIINKKQETRHR